MTAARGDPDRIAVLVRQVSQELFVDVPRGREHLELLVARSGWSPSPLRDTFVGAAQALLLALENVPWEERQRRLEALAQATRARMRATEIERLKAAIDAELARWHLFALAAPRVRLALGDPRAEEQALRALDPLPADVFVREDARALLAMARAADQPDRWVRLPERREEVRLAVRELRERIERTALAMVLAEEATVVARVLERQLADRHASLPTALLRTWAEGTHTVAGEPRAVTQSVFLQARRREVPAGAPWTRLPGWALAIELDGPIQAGGVTVTIDDKLTVHLGVAGIVVGGTFRPCQLAGARQVIVEPRFDGLLLRMPGAAPEELMVTLPEGPVVPVRFTARADETRVARLVLVSLPPRQAQDPRGVRGESIRRQRQGR
ncbi:MAG: hypothetical protein M9894_37335 [Planctomycetes bacterium]|nr:hypothetical protein [Planctomycetota bacterium]